MPGRSWVAWWLPVLLVLAGCGEGTERAASVPAARATPSAAPSGSPEPSSPPRGRVSATDVVDDPEATLVDVAVSPVDPQVRAAVWWTCPTPDCSVRHVAVAVTTDGFGSRVVADRVWRAVPLVTVDRVGNAVVTAWQPRLGVVLVRPDGSVVDVRRTSGESPVGAGEVVAGVEYGRHSTTFLATDPVSGTAHGISVPPGTAQLRQLPSGQLRALTRRRTYAWSEDGGATWKESTGASDGTLLQSFVTSSPDLHVLVGGGDGATLSPFEEIRVLDEWDSWSVVSELPDDPMAYVGATAVLPDGRFLADVDAWSDNGRLGGRPRGTPPGLYVSDGDDWASYSALAQGEPFVDVASTVPDVRYVDVTGGRTTLGAIGPDGRSWWTSTDLGTTWTEQPVR